LETRHKGKEQRFAIAVLDKTSTSKAFTPQVRLYFPTWRQTSAERQCTCSAYYVP